MKIGVREILDDFSGKVKKMDHGFHGLDGFSQIKYLCYFNDKWPFYYFIYVPSVNLD